MKTYHKDVIPDIQIQMTSPDKPFYHVWASYPCRVNPVSLSEECTKLGLRDDSEGDLLGDLIYKDAQGKKRRQASMEAAQEI